MGTSVKTEGAGSTDSKVSWIEAFVNDLLEPVGRKRRARAIEKLGTRLDDPAFLEHEVARRLKELRDAADLDRRYGVVLKAVVGVLGKRREGMRLCEIRRSVDELLGYAVPKSSILDCFARRSQGPGALFDRIGYGRYRLR